MENKNIQNKLWFRAKKYGWGWYPSSWQGWIIFLAYLGGIAWSAIRAVKVAEVTADSTSSFLWNYIPEFIILSIIMIFICYKTGEKPEWRWGK